MNKKPCLVIMAAGMGSRYGGLKQIDPVDAQGHIIMDFSIYDALLSGFSKVVFIIRKEHETLFREAVGDRVAQKTEVVYAFQDVAALPEGYAVPEGRTKPWGTGHAVLSAKPYIDGPFAVINADDFYGRGAFGILADFLSGLSAKDTGRYVMAGYVLGNTLTDNGSVSRGVCSVSEEGMLREICERKKIIRTEEAPYAAYYDEEKETWVPLSSDSAVSLNVWGFTPDFLDELEARFPAFLKKAMGTDPLKAEYFLPEVVEDLVKEEKASVSVLMTQEKWYGITYKEDKPKVKDAICAMEQAGIYPAEF